jgi:hypothetical protein
MDDIKSGPVQNSGKRNRLGIAAIVAAALIAGIVIGVALDRNDGTMPTQANSQPSRLPDQPPAAAQPADAEQPAQVQGALPSPNRADQSPMTTPEAPGAPSLSRASDDGERARVLRLAAAADALPSERSLLAGSSVNTAAVKPALGSAEFATLVQRLQSESSNDALAAEVARTYADTIRLQIGETSNRVTLSSFACGLKVCIGELSPGASDEDVDAWRARFNDDPRSPHSVFVGMPPSIREGRASFRFLLSFDSETNSLLVPTQ